MTPMTILYWAWPADGAGHAVRAAAICRHLKSEVIVLRGTDDPKINRALDHFQIPYITIPSRADAIRFGLANPADLFVLDDGCGTALDQVASLYIWRLGRPDKPFRPMPKINIEGPGSLWPLLMLDDDEILSKEEAREDLGWPQGKHLRVGITSTCRPGVVEAQDVDYMLEPWPALRWMRAADHIVGCIGANLYGEVNYLGLPATWIKAPHARDQSVRIYAPNKGAVIHDAARKVADIIENTMSRR